tara:strand:+ start:1634 stop:1810 length:177 start_codon:yes stop_codon:yes gene_type:complete
MIIFLFILMNKNKYTIKTFLFRGWERVLSRNFVEHLVKESSLEWSGKEFGKILQGFSL